MSTSSSIKKGLGKGLGALITSAQETPGGGVVTVDINSIEPNRQQPRQYFDDGALRELADSIREFGIIQPLIVREESGFFSIIAGERRWRAARIAGLREIPVVVKEYSEAETLQIALIENLQREDLNPVEEAMCYKRLMDDYFFSQDGIAAKIGKSRNSVSYALGLLNLEPGVLEYLKDGRLTPAHGRVLLQLKDGALQTAAAAKIAESGMSAREAEKLAAAVINKAEAGRDKAPARAKTAPFLYRGFEDELKNILGTKVRVRDGKNGGGKIEIDYYSPEDLDRLLGMFRNMRE
ncbi:MAG: ParB/RepB/Spo0J family partition protein [Firmicutes bacterium]|nr:ParB/RepB/Spo0J family partition protein [Bacillota bacterium]